MSHTSRISRVRIMDLSHLEGAIAELAQEGVPISMERGGTPRAYYANQQGLGPAEYTIKLHGCQYDVGVYKADDGRGYELRCDLWAGHVASVVGVDPSPFLKGGESREEREQIVGQAAMGRIYQRYAVVASEREAARAGHSTQRIEGENGLMQLRVGLAA